MITFMYEEINRFIALPNQEANFDQYFGTGKNEWRPGVGISQAQSRGRFFHDLYVKQLRNVANIQFVRSFEMRNDNDVIDYFLFYGTNSKAGLKKMKEAMWKVDQSGEFRFSDATDPNKTSDFLVGPVFCVPNGLGKTTMGAMLCIFNRACYCQAGHRPLWVLPNLGQNLRG